MSEARIVRRAIADILVRSDFGDAAVHVGGFRQHNFAVDLHDNKRTRIFIGSSRLDYACCRRS